MNAHGGGRRKVTRLTRGLFGFVMSPNVIRSITRMVLVGAMSVSLLGMTLSDGQASAPSALISQGLKLTGGEEESGEAHLGQSVALSADGDTALVGAPNDDGKRGAVWVFGRSGSTWTQQGVKLTGGEEESGEARFGHSVALSADGNTALIGATRDDGGLGAVWVFGRSGSTWTQQGVKLTGGEEESGGGWFGAGVALSADGNTALVGAPVDHNNVGAVWVFGRSGSTWTQQGVKLTGGEEESGGGWFGASVALSPGGETAVIGAPSDSSKRGAVWVFGRSGSTWTQQGAKLTGGEEENGAGHLGDSVALSADGETALVGARDDGSKQGAAWVFGRSGSTWTQQGAKLTGGAEGSDEQEFGDSVALSASGETALVGGHRDSGELGAAWVFEHSGLTWTQQGAKLSGAEEWGRGEFGRSVALSSDGETALIGGDDDHRKVGAAWVFATQPLTPEPKLTPEPNSTQTVQSSDPPTTSPKQGTAPFKANSGRVSLVSATITVRNGHALVKLKCVSTATCRGTLKLAINTRRSKRTNIYGIGQARFVMGAGRTAVVKLKLNKMARARLRAARGRLGARLAIVVSSPSPSRTQQNRVIRLVLSRASRVHKKK